MLRIRRNTSEIPTGDHQRMINRDVWTVTGADGRLQVQYAIRPASAKLAADCIVGDVVLADASRLAAV